MTNNYQLTVNHRTLAGDQTSQVVMNTEAMIGVYPVSAVDRSSYERSGGCDGGVITDSSSF